MVSLLIKPRKGVRQDEGMIINKCMETEVVNSFETVEDIISTVICVHISAPLLAHVIL